MSPITRSMVLWVPDWPILASLRVAPLVPATTDAPLALIDKGIVFACSASARIEGVQRGLRVREAQARCTDLVVRPYEQQLDSRTFETVITAIEELMPGVQLVRPGIAAVRSRGPARYYGGEQPAGLALVALLDELGIPGARVGYRRWSVYGRAGGTNGNEYATSASRARGQHPPSSLPGFLSASSKTRC